jgi:hypothetical protein
MLLRFLKRSKPFEYPAFFPPFKMKPRREMTDEEAAQHFDWFVEMNSRANHSNGVANED